MYSTPKNLATILRNAQGVADKETGRDIDVGRECLLIREEWDALHKELARVREERDSLFLKHEDACRKLTDALREMGNLERHAERVEDAWIRAGEGFYVEPPPTHWMPLPAPPAGDEK